jgi:carboxymethylenebutenolidase
MKAPTLKAALATLNPSPVFEAVARFAEELAMNRSGRDRNALRGRSMSQSPPLRPEEQRLNDIWQEHLRTEFQARNADEALATMVENPLVNAVPAMIGGDSKEGVYEFYAKYFLPQIPPDMEMVPVSRTIGQGRLVEEMVARFTHSVPMDWMLPGIPPTGKRVEIALLVVVQFDGDKMAHEHLYWDQASVLVQLGLLQRAALPVVGAEGARSVLDRKIPLNELLYRAELLHRATATPPKSVRRFATEPQFRRNRCAR